ncbi:peptidyl-prolyl cis-trans isomerase FKBP19, chloroplastic isoform X2 [Diospyros lotus]|uniref:peptidyl-prolyl cis-trans isomerase FKBP19, chloroplastic isoform X2 n=1 Tax=Diospyros lotus TaxID=55363 RepID=UPI00225B5AD4|nr:peptidyl-prolyl cis-trans isomerase FKBP19, chloroplastic isoform X2 [Diospyros lotus]
MACSISALGSSLSLAKPNNSSAAVMRQHPKSPRYFPEPAARLHPNPSDASNSCGARIAADCGAVFDRRNILLLISSATVGSIAPLLRNSSKDGIAVAAEFADMPALRGKDYGKTKMRYPDYTETESGLQYKDLRGGSGPTPKSGDTVVVDWDGYTIGYYGRIFEARNKTKGGSFEGDDKDFYKFRVGSQQVIPAFEEAVSGMALGGIRRIIVPPELGYPYNDFNKMGPRPTTFSGQRALDFVLRNQGLIDKTLLFDIELLKIIPN